MGLFLPHGGNSSVAILTQLIPPPEGHIYLSEPTEWYLLIHGLLMVHQPLMEPKRMENGKPIEQRWNGQSSGRKHKIEAVLLAIRQTIGKAKGKPLSSPMHGTCAMV